jgi:two-component system phosphate regulon sensor histidine kinase PhoR
VTVGARLAGERVDLEVADSGPGIEARHLPRLFERFYRVDTSRSRELGGTGLGLSIVKHLVDSLGGAVRVESELGKGSRFVESLPRDAWQQVTGAPCPAPPKCLGALHGSVPLPSP